MEVPKRRYRTDGEKSKWCINESLGLQLKPPMAALFMDFKSVLLCYCEHRTHPSWFKQKRYFDDIRQLTESPGEPAWKPLSQEQRPCHPSTCSWEALRRHTLALRCIAGPFRTTSRTGMVQGTEAVWSGAELTPFSLLYRWKERTSQYWRGGGGKSAAYLLWGTVGEEVFSMCGHSPNTLAPSPYSGLFGREGSSS